MEDRRGHEHERDVGRRVVLGARETRRESLAFDAKSDERAKSTRRGWLAKVSIALASGRVVCFCLFWGLTLLEAYTFIVLLAAVQQLRG